MKIIKLFDPYITKNEEKYLISALKSGQWASGAGSKYVSLFEKKFQEYIDAKACVSVNSGTAALHLALSVANVTGKEVIIPSLSFVSTAHAVMYNGGKVIFADVDPITLCLDPESVKKKISKKTCVILPVHFGGMPSNLRELEILADNANAMLIDDASHAAGAKFDRKRIGSHGIMSCFSFHPVKNLAMPTGGLVAINHKNHDHIRKILLSRRWCGIADRKGVDYDVKELGWNFYMNEFSAAVGLAQLSALDKSNKIRLNVASRYNKEINVERKMPLNKDCSYHFYWILTKNRNQFRKKMLENGIETGIHYKPIHKMSMYSDDVKLPVTEKISQQIVTLPTHPNLTEENINKIIESVNKFS